MKFILKIILSLFPWPLKRFMLIHIYKYNIHPTARIGISYVFPKHLEMHENSRIGHLNTIINLSNITLGKNSVIERNNWITGFPTGTKSRHFAHQNDRISELLMGKNSAITKYHHIDCTHRVKIGDFVTIAGYNSQFLTHSIDISENRQNSAPIEIGNYCFVGTNVVILGGTQLPAYSVLGAKSLLNKIYNEEWMLYGGVPAKPISEIPKESKYFKRSEGFVF